MLLLRHRGGFLIRPFFVTPPSLWTKAPQSIPPCGAFAGYARRFEMPATGRTCWFLSGNGQPANTVPLCVPTREKGTPERPQTLRCPENSNHSSTENGQSSAEAIQNGPPAAAGVTACSAGDPVQCPSQPSPVRSAVRGWHLRWPSPWPSWRQHASLPARLPRRALRPSCGCTADPARR